MKEQQKMTTKIMSTLVSELPQFVRTVQKAPCVGNIKF